MSLAEGFETRSEPKSRHGSPTGEEFYPVPAAVDPAQYNEVHIWCQRYSVPLGVAKLK